MYKVNGPIPVLAADARRAQYTIQTQYKRQLLP